MDAFQYNSLKDIDDCHELNSEDLNCLDEIRSVLMRHKKTERFGVNLLHRHFDIADDECVVEYTDKKNRTLTAVVEKKSTSQSVETMWRFDTDDTGYCHRMCNRTCSKWGSWHDANHQNVGHIDNI